MEWVRYNGLSEEDYIEAKEQSHIAIQNVSALARAYLPDDEADANAVLHWVPGFWRMAGKWVKGEKSFRSSLSFKDFNIYLLDQKVSVLAQCPLFGKTPNQVMVWLEEQILSLGLGSKAITLNLPYKLPFARNRDKFNGSTPHIYYEFGKLYHNTYQVLLELKNHFPDAHNIEIWPHHFDMALTFTLKETGEKATNTMVTAGFSPGDEYFDGPYFYVNTWPHVVVEELPALNKGIWFSEDWSGAVVILSEINKTEKPADTLLAFYSEAITRLSLTLLD